MLLRAIVVTTVVAWLLLPLAAQVSSPLSLAQEAVSDSDSASSSAADLPETEKSITRRIEALQQQRAEFRTTHGYPPEPEAEDPLSVRRAQLIYEADNQLGGLINALTNRIGLIGASRTVELDEWGGEPVAGVVADASAEKEVSLEMLDQLYGFKASLSEQKQIIETEVKRLDPKLVQAEKQFELAQSVLRSVREGKKEALAKDTEETAEVAVFVAEVKLELTRQLSRNARSERDIFTGKIEFINQVIRDSRQQLNITPERKQELADEYQAKSKELQISLVQAQARLNQIEQQLNAASDSEEKKVVMLLQQAAQEKVSLNQAWINHHHLLYQYTTQQIRLYEEALTSKEKFSLENKVETELEQFAADIQFLQNQFARAEEQLEQLSGSFKVEEEKQTSQSYVAVWEITDSIQQQIWSAEKVRSKLKILNNELAVKNHLVSWSVVQQQVKHRLSAFWDKQLFVVNEREFTVSKLFWVLLLLPLGFILSGQISRLTGRLLIKRTGAGSGASAAYEKLIYYFLIVMVSTIIFKVFGFSLTSLTVVSGALALAVGFGSQEILKNFISGIILLVERPIHKDDIIEMDGRTLRVESIGARSTRVRDLDHTQRIVPNSMLLENVITNWTLSDDVLRSEVTVGVAYGSDTRQTAQLLAQAAKQVEQVLETPEPFAAFKDFGANSLDFSVYFWTRTENRLRISSEVRHEMAQVLTEAGIVISFPQRDVHLDSVKPIEVSLKRGDWERQETLD